MHIFVIIPSEHAVLAEGLIECRIKIVPAFV
jgi:hypothetical protein